MHEQTNERHQRLGSHIYWEVFLDTNYEQIHASVGAESHDNREYEGWPHSMGRVAELTYTRKPVEGRVEFHETYELYRESIDASEIWDKVVSLVVDSSVTVAVPCHKRKTKRKRAPGELVRRNVLLETLEHPLSICF